MQGYVSIFEATKLTGKHKDTIRRLVKQNKTTNNIVTGKKGYLINKEWLLSHYELTPDKTTHTEAPQSVFTTQDEHTPTQTEQAVITPVIEALSNQLAAKDEQIAKLQALLSEKEANTTKLQDQFQQLLARQTLPASFDNGAASAYVEPMPATEPDKPTTKQANNPPKSTNKKKKKPAKSKPAIEAVEAKPPKRKRFSLFNR